VEEEDMIRKFLMATTCSAALVFGAAGANAAALLEEVKDSDQLSTFAKAIEAAELEDTLEGDGPFTIFAPTDDAFDELPDGVVDALMEGDNKDQLEKLLKAHIVEGEQLTESDIKDADESKVKVEPMAGDELTIDASGDEVRLELASRTEGEDSGGAGATMGSTGQPSAGGGMAGQQPQQPGAGTGQPSTGAMAGQQPSTGATQPQQPGAGTGQPSTTVVTPGAGDDDDIGSREAKVAEADVEADNGVIHVIDAVLVPADLRQELRELKD
jgi:uncharacterized surface protein with fasciclin (FAS1) repeats